MRRGIVSLGLILLITLAGSAPLAAQAGGGWSVQVEGRGGLFKATRDIGKILGENNAQIRTTIQVAPTYSFGLILSGPSPNYSFRVSGSYMSADARGQAGACAVLSGPGCVSLDVSTTATQGTLDVLVHSDDGSSVLKYFLGGVGLRSYSFDRLDCRDANLDPNLQAVCSPMMEFLANQQGLVGRLGLGFMRGVGPVSMGLEIIDQVSLFEGAGERGEGGIQNDVMLSVGVSFPGR